MCLFFTCLSYADYDHLSWHTGYALSIFPIMLSRRRKEM